MIRVENTGYSIGFAILSALLLINCATLDRDECRNADWRLIGYEDGSKGRLSDYLGNHREACAEYDVTPDMEAYLQGRAEGLTEYCRPQNGYLLGKRGSSYRGICPGSMEHEFMVAYRYGKDVYNLQYQIKRAGTHKKNKTKQLEKLNEALKTKEAELIKFETSTERRIQLLVEIRDASEEQGTLEAEINELVREQAKLRERLNILTHASPYS